MDSDRNDPQSAPFAPQPTATLRDGQPYATTYDDVYHSRAGGLGQARHVFLGGNGLPQRWRGREQFVIVETGFGVGLNFLATWAAWRADRDACARLHFVSIEKHPFAAAALAQMLAAAGIADDPALAALAQQLCAQWPSLSVGVHRVVLDDGAVTLTLAFGDIQQWLPQLVVGADAFYLDGFAPSRNPQMWSPDVIKGLAKLARDDATLATYTSAGFVRRGLEDAGFAVGRVPGYGGKREMIAARFAPRWQRRHAPAAAKAPGTVLVIGAGLAGCTAAAALAARGWHVTVLEREAGVARQTSAHRAAILHPHLSADDNLLSRAARAGFWAALSRWRQLERAGFELDRGAVRGQSGMLDRAADASAAGKMQQMLAALQLPEDFARWCDANEATAQTGVPSPHGGIWFAHGDWIAPPSWCAAELASERERIQLRCGVDVARLGREPDGGWSVFAADGERLASADVVVLANTFAAPRLLAGVFGDAEAAAAALPLKPVRGQLSYLPEAALPVRPRAIVCGEGYLLPMRDGWLQTGASYANGDDRCDLREADHRYNLERLQRQLGAPLVGGIDAWQPKVDGFAAPRCNLPDRLPLFGAVLDWAALAVLQADNPARTSGLGLNQMPRLSGVYIATAFGSRGLTWAALAADCVASMIAGEPLPLEAALRDACDPARFVVRKLRAQVDLFARQ